MTPEHAAKLLTKAGGVRIVACCWGIESGFKHSLILDRFPSVTQLREHSGLFDWKRV